MASDTDAVKLSDVSARTGESDVWAELVLRKLKVIGLDEGFVENLGEQTDWAIAVQCVALVETALNDTLHRHFQQPEIDHWLSRLNFRRKLDCLRDLGYAGFGLLDPTQQSELRRDWEKGLALADLLSTIRNRYAHEIRNVTRSLKDVIAELPAGDQAKFEAARKLVAEALPELEAADRDKGVLISIAMVLIFLLGAHDSARHKLGPLLSSIGIVRRALYDQGKGLASAAQRQEPGRRSP